MGLAHEAIFDSTHGRTLMDPQIGNVTSPSRAEPDDLAGINALY